MVTGFKEKRQRFLIGHVVHRLWPNSNCVHSLSFFWCGVAQATRIVARMTAERAENPDKAVPREILRRARGLAFVRVAKVGFGLSVKLGTGIVVARLGDSLDSWSAPCAIGTAGKHYTIHKFLEHSIVI